MSLKSSPTGKSEADPAAASPSTGKTLYPDTNSVVDAVECLQQRKMKPDAEKIAIYIEKNWPQAYKRDPKMVDVLVAECLAHGLIVCVNNQGATSFRTPSKIGRMLRITKILPFDGEVPDSVVYDVLRTIGEIEMPAPNSTDQVPIGRGVALSVLVKYLHQSLRLLNYTEELIEDKVMATALLLQYAAKVSEGKYRLTPAYRLEYGINFPARNYLSDESDEEEKSDSDMAEQVEEEAIAPPKKKSKSPDKSRKSESSRDSPTQESPTTRPVTRRRMNDSPIDIDDEEEEDEEKEDDPRNDSNEKDMDIDEEMDRDNLNDDLKNSDSKDPQPQRVSTRKKFKKSLGPDFVDTSEQLMYYLKESNYVPKCSICTGGFPKYKPNIPGKKPRTTPPEMEPSDPYMIQCMKCELKAHILCLKLSETVGLRYQWRCGTCGTCSHCKQNRRKDYSITCKSCKRSYHTLCASVRRNTNESAWECDRCRNARLGDSSSSNTSLLSSKPPRSTPTVTTSSTVSSHGDSSKSRTLLSRTATATLAPKPLLTKVNSQPVHVMKPNTSLLSRTTSESSSNSLLLPISNGQPSTKLSASNIILNNITDKPRHSDKSQQDSASNSASRDSLLHAKSVTKTNSIENKDEPSENKTNKKQALRKMDQNVKLSETSKQSANQKYGPSLKDVLDQKTPLEIKHNFIAWVNCELKNYVKCNPTVLYQLPANLSRWKPKDVHTFMATLGFNRTAQILLDNNVDGIALLLLRREDIIERLALKMGPALKLNAFLCRLRAELEVD